jgi:hypothetical protein
LKIRSNENPYLKRIFLLFCSFIFFSNHRTFFFQFYSFTLRWLVIWLDDLFHIAFCRVIVVLRNSLILNWFFKKIINFVVSKIKIKMRGSKLKAWWKSGPFKKIWWKCLLARESFQFLFWTLYFGNYMFLV